MGDAVDPPQKSIKEQVQINVPFVLTYISYNRLGSILVPVELNILFLKKYYAQAQSIYAVVKSGNRHQEDLRDVCMYFAHSQAKRRGECSSPSLGRLRLPGCHHI